MSSWNWIALTVVVCGTAIVGFTFMPRSGPATSLGIVSPAKAARDSSALHIHSITKVDHLPVQAYDAF
jgi:hypothetical protein